MVLKYFWDCFDGDIKILLKGLIVYIVGVKLYVFFISCVILFVDLLEVCYFWVDVVIIVCVVVIFVEFVGYNRLWFDYIYFVFEYVN